MYIAILQDGEVENEVNVDLCCASCAHGTYRWTAAQYDFVNEQSQKEKPIPVPHDVDNIGRFAEYIRYMKL